MTLGCKFEQNILNVCICVSQLTSPDWIRKLGADRMMLRHYFSTLVRGRRVGILFPMSLLCQFLDRFMTVCLWVELVANFGVSLSLISMAHEPKSWRNGHIWYPSIIFIPQHHIIYDILCYITQVCDFAKNLISMQSKEILSMWICTLFLLT